MNVKRPAFWLMIGVLGIVIFNGCARYATSDRKITALEDEVSIGMSEREFTERIPQAELLADKDGKKIYGLRVSEPCFICGSSKGFQQSFESYATQFVFEEGNLVSFERILDGV